LLLNVFGIFLFYFIFFLPFPSSRSLFPLLISHHYHYHRCILFAFVSIKDKQNKEWRFVPTTLAGEVIRGPTTCCK
jgi:hypothetical protein